MNNPEAMVILVAKRAAINSAVNGLNEYVTQVVEKDRYRVADAEKLMSEVKAFATHGGADIRTWDGSKAPVVDDV